MTSPWSAFDLIGNVPWMSKGYPASTVMESFDTCSFTGAYASVERSRVPVEKVLGARDPELDPSGVSAGIKTNSPTSTMAAIASSAPTMIGALERLRGELAAVVFRSGVTRTPPLIMRIKYGSLLRLSGKALQVCAAGRTKPRAVWILRPAFWAEHDGSPSLWYALATCLP